MSKIDYQALREAAERAIPAMERLLMLPVDDDLLSEQELKDYGVDIDALNAFKFLTGPETMLALLDELEKMQAQSSKWCEAFHKAVSVGARYEERIAELERKEQHSDRQSVIDALASSGDEWSDIEECMQKWDAERAAAAGKGEAS